MIRVGSRLPVRSAAGAVLALAGAAVLAAPAHARAELPLVAETTVVQDGPATVSDVRWVLPAEAAPGDTVELFLPEHAGGAAGADWISSTGVVIGTARLDATGRLVIELTDAVADPANRAGEAIVRSTEEVGPPIVTASSSTADAILRPGERPGPFYGIPDRTRGNKYGFWVDEDETRARWVVEAPRGPWDVLDIVDRVGPGQRVDCAAGVSVRSAVATHPDTGALVDPVDVPAERVRVDCGETEVAVHVEPVGDEIVEVALDTLPDAPSTEITNAATFEARRTQPGEPVRAVGWESLLVEQPPVPPTAPPTPEPPLPEPPLPEPPVAETPVPAPPVPARLAETGSEGSAVSFAAAAVGLLAAGWTALALHARRARGRA